MKKLIFTKRMLMLVFAIAAYGISAMAQEPASVTTPQGTLYQQGTNSGGAAASEDPDLVTTGTTVPYLVLPDADLNPDWAIGTDATNTTDLVSSFDWTVPSGISSAGATATIHYVEIVVDGTAGTTDNITVAEENGASCVGTPSSIPVLVVAQPDATALAVDDGDSEPASNCAAGTNGSLAAAVPTFTLTQAIDGNITTPEVEVIASLDFLPLNGTSTSVFSDETLTVSSGGVVDLSSQITELNSWGTYTLTITQISDNISRKDIASDGFFNVNEGTDLSTTYTLLKQPTTGTIYRLPNN
ncbi:MAG: hypothetical protein ACOC0C_06725 [Bacteroidota bacterium]